MIGDTAVEAMDDRDALALFRNVSALLQKGASARDPVAAA